MKIQAGSHLIGDDCPPFIICEIGSNWRTLQDCMDSIVKAKQSGADAVKFQLFTHKALFGRAAGEIWPQVADLQESGALPLEWLPKLKEKADAVGIEFMCTAFSPELYDAVDKFVNIHKVASAEMTHLRILQKLRKLGKPVIMSTGAKGVEDIGMALDVLSGHQWRAQGMLYLPPTQWGGGETHWSDYHPVSTILMYCVAAYPASEVNLDTIPLLREAFRTLVGYSDHSVDIAVIPKEAVRAGACVVEKHFTAIPGVDTPDRGHSLTPEQFKQMVHSIRGTLRPHIGPTAGEEEMVLRHNRRVIATRDIAAGDSLQEGVNMGIYRSLKDDTKAAHPFAIGDLNGKRAKRFIPAGDGIAPGDV